jgi:hypothetical protein
MMPFLIPCLRSAGTSKIRGSIIQIDKGFYWDGGYMATADNRYRVTGSGIRQPSARANGALEIGPEHAE